MTHDERKTRSLLSVMENKALAQHIGGYQTGIAYKDWDDGDKAAAAGHLYLLEKLPDLIYSSAAMDRAALNGHFEVVKWLHKNRPEGCTHEALNNAAANGHLDIVKWLHFNRKEGCTEKAVNAAAANGHLAVVDFLIYNRREGGTELAIDNAAKNGHMEVVKYLYEHKYPCTEMAINEAAANHLGIVEYLLNKGIACTYLGVNKAILGGQLEILQLIFEYFPDIFENEHRLADVAADFGQLEILRWLLSLNLQLTAGSCTGGLEMAQFCHAHGGHFGDSELAAAAKMGDLPSVEFLISIGVTSLDANNLAVANGHLPVVEYLHEQNFPVVEMAVDVAAGNGHLHILKWLHENNIHGSHNSLKRAAARGHLEVVKWLLENTDKGQESALNTAATFEIYLLIQEKRRFPVSNKHLLMAIKNGSVKMVTWLLDKQLALEEKHLETAVESNHLPVVKLLLESLPLAPITTNLIKLAVGHGNLVMVKMLFYQRKARSSIDHGRPEADSQLVDAAAGRGQLPIIKYLHESKISSPNAAAVAAVARSYKTLKWLLENTEQKPVRQGFVTLTNGNLDILKLLHKYKFGFSDANSMDVAASQGNLSLIKWLNKVRPGHNQAFKQAVGAGHLTILKWLHENVREVGTEEDMMVAANHGRLSIIMWLRRTFRLPNSYRVFNFAIRAGNFEIVKYLHESRTGTYDAQKVIDMAISKPQIMAYLEAATVNFDRVFEYQAPSDDEDGAQDDDDEDFQW